MTDVLIEERPQDVRFVRLNRPDRRNALTPDMVAQITGAMLVERRHRAVVITGNGRAFCAGVDIAGAHERQAGRSNADAIVLQERFAGMVLAIAKAPVPVVSAVNGPAAGAGMAIALASDVRIGTEAARFIIGGAHRVPGEAAAELYRPLIRPNSLRADDLLVGDPAFSRLEMRRRAAV